ncbi:hypothetical protein PsorP6_001479 [Peronosclerospora sorghi]|uniref:Uncharacterized protein n=1 Tax=Peronosclerospora sorghi TaxID=230839 RepID=A0ACC0WT09_9STRA|nr:hypothetical protein PsorP6_001479 [Peronosclerospora sorghi]
MSTRVGITVEEYSSQSSAGSTNRKSKKEIPPSLTTQRFAIQSLSDPTSDSKGHFLSIPLCVLRIEALLGLLLRLMKMWHRLVGLLCFASCSASTAYRVNKVPVMSNETSSDSSAFSKSTRATLATKVPSSADWHMSPVTVIQARVQGDAPVWNKRAQRWLSKYGNTTELAYRNNLDTVNTASVEGALMYVQAEGINVNEQSVKCERKNKMQYIVFYQVTIVQPTYGIKYYENHTPPEYGKFVAMDGAKCTDQGSDLSEDCKVYYGLDGEMKIGPMVGSTLQTTDPRAPYAYNHWFSYANSCAQKLREDKTDECRAEYPGGLCPLGVEPDGKNCTFSYTILGFLNLDDLVGITDMGYRSYKEFCEDGGIEFKATNTGKGFDVDESIDFWKDPGDKDANTERTQKMIRMYNAIASSSAYMKPLPSIAKLTASNPKCYQNSAKCANAPYGCRRSLYSQICSVCSSSDPCETGNFKFPTLTLPSNSSTSSSGKTSNDISQDTGFSPSSSQSRLRPETSGMTLHSSQNTSERTSASDKASNNAGLVAATSSLVTFIALVASSWL